MGRLESKSVAELKKIAQRYHNKYVRYVDNHKPCISCDGWGEKDAGHYISVGMCDAMRFDYENVHGQCQSCNRFKGGNQLKYRFGLIRRYGEYYVKKIEERYLMFKSTFHKWDRHTLLEIIKERKEKIKRWEK